MSSDSMDTKCINTQQANELPEKAMMVKLKKQVTTIDEVQNKVKSIFCLQIQHKISMHQSKPKIMHKFKHYAAPK